MLYAICAALHGDSGTSRYFQVFALTSAGFEHQFCYSEQAQQSPETISPWSALSSMHIRRRVWFATCADFNSEAFSIQFSHSVTVAHTAWSLAFFFKAAVCCCCGCFTDIHFLNSPLYTDETFSLSLLVVLYTYKLCATRLVGCKLSLWHVLANSFQSVRFGSVPWLTTI